MECHQHNLICCMLGELGAGTSGSTTDARVSGQREANVLSFIYTFMCGKHVLMDFGSDPFDV